MKNLTLVDGWCLNSIARQSSITHRHPGAVRRGCSHGHSRRHSATQPQRASGPGVHQRGSIDASRLKTWATPLERWLFVEPTIVKAGHALDWRASSSCSWVIYTSADIRNRTAAPERYILRSHARLRSLASRPDRAACREVSSAKGHAEQTCLDLNTALRQPTCKP